MTTHRTFIALVVALIFTLTATAHAAPRITDVSPIDCSYDATSEPGICGPTPTGDAQPIRARVTTDTGTLSSVVLHWYSHTETGGRWFSGNQTVPMTPDADGIYRASIPADAFRPGATVGWHLTASDSASNMTSAPFNGSDYLYWVSNMRLTELVVPQSSVAAGQSVRVTSRWQEFGAPITGVTLAWYVRREGQDGWFNGGAQMTDNGSGQYTGTIPGDALTPGATVFVDVTARDADGNYAEGPRQWQRFMVASGTTPPPPVDPPVDPCKANPASCQPPTPTDPCVANPDSCKPPTTEPNPTDPCVANPASCEPVAPTPATVCRVDRIAPGEGTDGDRVRVYGQFSGTPEFSFRDGDTSRRALLDAWSDTEAIVYVPRFELRAAKTALSVYSDCVVGTSRTRSGDTPFVYTTTNQPPVAVPLEQQVRSASSKSRKGRSSSKRASRRLDGTSSYDRDGKVVAYRWTLGKKVVSRKASTPVAGAKTRRYTLCVTDDRGAKGCKAITVKAKAPRTVKVTLNNDVLFGYDSSRLSAKGKTALGKLRGYMRQAQTVRVEGHASAEGSAAYNMALSKARATTVRKSLLTGLTRKPKTAVVARGESKPVASNATEAGRAKNRRVVITITLRK